MLVEFNMICACNAPSMLNNRKISYYIVSWYSWLVSKTYIETVIDRQINKQKIQSLERIGAGAPSKVLQKTLNINCLRYLNAVNIVALHKRSSGKT